MFLVTEKHSKHTFSSFSNTHLLHCINAPKRSPLQVFDLLDSIVLFFLVVYLWRRRGGGRGRHGTIYLFILTRSFSRLLAIDQRPSVLAKLRRYCERTLQINKIMLQDNILPSHYAFRTCFSSRSWHTLLVLDCICIMVGSFINIKVKLPLNGC